MFLFHLPLDRQVNTASYYFFFPCQWTDKLIQHDIVSFSLAIAQKVNTAWHCFLLLQSQQKMTAWSYGQTRDVTVWRSLSLRIVFWIRLWWTSGPLLMHQHLSKFLMYACKELKFIKKLLKVSESVMFLMCFIRPNMYSICIFSKNQPCVANPVHSPVHMTKTCACNIKQKH